MKPLNIQTTVEFTPTHLIVDACPRYWEDATVDGVEDTNGSLIPLREGDSWRIAIGLDAGRIVGWPQGTVASVHYKVCDNGEYWLEDKNERRAKYKSDYVPDGLLCMGDKGYGDYIILKINENGYIQNWKPEIDEEDWELV